MGLSKNFAAGTLKYYIPLTRKCVMPDDGRKNGII